MTTRYKLKDSEPIGQGGFGKVKKGEDVILERKVAVKSLNDVWDKVEESERERFRREARTLARLSHPHIPAIYDVVYDDKKFEIVFQFVEGSTLRQILAAEQTVKLSECLIWFDQIASALGHAHENNIIHRDVKPENIIVSPDRKHCYLVDFGIAFSKVDGERLTDSDQWIGTEGYMSPEQKNGEELDGSDDIYVLGGCLYEVLCGHPIEPGHYQSLNSINELIPPAIDDLVRNCIDRKPIRLKSSAEFRSKLQAALSKHRALSELLSAGQLHEIVGAIAEMTPTQFMELKAGQRLLILQKCHDLVKSTDRRLIAARDEMIEILTPLGIHLTQHEYQKIIVPAIRFGFGPPIDSTGASSIKCIRAICNAVTSAASHVTVPNHHVIVAALLDWIRDVNLESQPTWLFHSLRNLVACLMANPECEDADAPQLASILSQVNELQSSRGHDTDHDADHGFRSRASA